MPTITYPYLVEGTTFDAASLNTRFGPVGAVGFGINALMGYAAKRGCFQEEHLPETGIVAAEDFTVTNLTRSINPQMTNMWTPYTLRGVATMTVKSLPMALPLFKLRWGRG